MRALVEDGADLSRRDTIDSGTPLGWAMHGEQTDTARAVQYRAIVADLREYGAL